MKQHFFLIVNFAMIGLLSSCRTLPREGTDGSQQEQGDAPLVPSSPIVLPASHSTPSAKKSTDPTLLQIQQSCEHPVQLLHETRIMFFPSTPQCAFGVEPNRGATPGTVTAQAVSHAELNLASGQRVCSLSVQAQNREFRYQKAWLLLLEGRVLGLSHAVFLEKLAAEDQLYPWDFRAVVGQSWSDQSSPYCLGGTDQCQIPLPGVSGPLAIKMNLQTFAPFYNVLANKRSLDWQMVIFGGDQALDCAMEAQSFLITLNYIKMP